MLTNRKLRISLGVLLIALLVGQVMFYAWPQQAEADALSEYQSQQQKIKNEIAALKSELKDAKTELNDYQRQLADADMKVQEAEDLMEALERQLSAAEKELTTANEELAAAQADLTTQLGAFKTRLRENYINGDVGLLDVVFDATSMEDFITRSYYMERILLYDSNMIASINEQIEVIQEKRELQEKKIANLDTLTAEQKAVIANLEAARSEKGALVAAAKDSVDAVNSQIATRERESKEIEALIRSMQSTDGGVGSGIYAWPLRGYTSVSSDYGWRTLRGKRNLHTGIDMPAPRGTPIYSVDSGKVILARWYGSYGNCVIIDHGNNISSLYAHQSKLGCKVGDTVKQGQVIGYVGSTGNSTGNHLHLEIRKNGSHVSPWNYVSKPK
ncbi:MAG: peptidoglycan DD-metalloendopeptidase family protein [Firmicutes bacterium]|nr:peptidoglycan DD-metalloendopeptidase family protein [Bacillota bacterium]